MSQIGGSKGSDSWRISRWLHSAPPLHDPDFLSAIPMNFLYCEYFQENLTGLDAILVPVGNGALISGIGAWMLPKQTEIQVFL